MFMFVEYYKVLHIPSPEQQLSHQFATHKIGDRLNSMNSHSCWESKHLTCRLSFHFIVPLQLVETRSNFLQHLQEHVQISLRGRLLNPT